MEMPEGWKNLRLPEEASEFVTICLTKDELNPLLDLMKEMAQTIELYSKALYGFHPQLDVKGPAIQTLKKFKEWK